MITSKGIGILLVAIIVFLLARVTQVGWLYLVDALLWGILILSAVLPWLGVVMMSARLRLDIEGASAAGVSPSEGDRIRIQVSLRNRAFWPRFVFGLYYDCPLVKPESCLRRFFVTQLAASAQMSSIWSSVSGRRSVTFFRYRPSDTLGITPVLLKDSVA